MTQSTPLTIFNTLPWPALLALTWAQNTRTRLIMSPPGISMTGFGGNAATPWSNVEGIRMIAPGIQGKLGQVPCLVLREPIQTRLWSRARGIPAELKGRVIPIYPNMWERPLSLEEELYGYLKDHAAIQGQPEPVDFTTMVRRQERLGFWMAIAGVVIVGIAMYISISAALN